MKFLQQIDVLAYSYSTRIAIAIFTLLLGYILVRTLKAFTFKLLGQLNIDKTLLSFLRSLLGMSYYIFLFILVLTIAGIPTTYFAGMLIGLGTAIGFGLKGEFKAISNGIIILITKPFKIGDVIQVNGYVGTVIDIQLFQTVLRNAENMNVTLNNGLITTNGIINLLSNEHRRQDILIKISYDDNLNDTKNVLEEIIRQNKSVLRKPESLVTINDYAENSVIFLIRVWSSQLDVEKVKFSINEHIKEAFDKGQISTPYTKHRITKKST